MSSDPQQPEFTDELLSAYLDGELTEEQRAAVDRRLASDETARQLLDQLQTVSKSIRSLPPEALGENFSASVLEAAADSFSQAVPGSQGTSPARPVTVVRNSRGWIYATLAVSAALMIAFVQTFQQAEVAAPNRPLAKAPATATEEVRELRASAGREATPGAAEARDRFEDRDSPGSRFSSGALAGGGARGGESPQVAAEANRNAYVVRVTLTSAAARGMNIEQAIRRNSFEIVPVTPAETQAPPSAPRLQSRHRVRDEVPIELDGDDVQKFAASDVRERADRNAESDSRLAGRTAADAQHGQQAGDAVPPPAQVIAIETTVPRAGNFLQDLSEDRAGIVELDVAPIAVAADPQRWSRLSRSRHQDRSNAPGYQGISAASPPPPAAAGAPAEPSPRSDASPKDANPFGVESARARSRPAAKAGAPFGETQAVQAPPAPVGRDTPSSGEGEAAPPATPPRPPAGLVENEDIKAESAIGSRPGKGAATTTAADPPAPLGQRPNVEPDPEADAIDAEVSDAHTLDAEVADADDAEGIDADDADGIDADEAPPQPDASRESIVETDRVDAEPSPASGRGDGAQPRQQLEMAGDRFGGRAIRLAPESGQSEWLVPWFDLGKNGDRDGGSDFEPGTAHGRDGSGPTDAEVNASYRELVNWLFAARPDARLEGRGRSGAPEAERVRILLLVEVEPEPEHPPSSPEPIP